MEMKNMVKKEKVENKILNTHGAHSPDVGKAVSSMETSKRTLASANQKGTKYKSMAMKFYPPASTGNA